MNEFKDRDYLVARDRTLRDFPDDTLPNFPFIFNGKRNYFEAKCPKCGRITTIRTCYGCKELMCLDCLTEHQMICLHKELK